MGKEKNRRKASKRVNRVLVNALEETIDEFIEQVKESCEENAHNASQLIFEVEYQLTALQRALDLASKACYWND